MTRHELKEQVEHDQFTDSVSSVLEYASTHKERVIQWSIVAVIAAAVIIGVFWFRSHRRAERQRDLQNVFAILDAQVGPSNDYVKTFPTQQAKTDASIKALSALVAKDGGSHAGYLAQYYLGTLKAQQGDMKGAEADLKTVASSSSDSAALAKIALAQVYASTGRTPEAQTLLRSLVDKPSDLVSKSQAQVLLAQIDAAGNPKQAKEILQDLKGPNVSPAAARAASQLAAQIAK